MMVKWLRKQGFEAYHTQYDLNLSKDKDIAERALELGFIVITADERFVKDIPK